MGLPLYLVDAFTERPFAGNPAAVCLLPHPADALWMQQLAAELNFAETAFAYPDKAGQRLRWFTPLREVDLCGHATLATAHVLWETERVRCAEPIRFETRSGLLIAHLERGEAGEGSATIWLDFPAWTLRPCTLPPGLLEALEVTGAARHLGVAGNAQVIEVESEEVLRGLNPDMRRLAQVRMQAVLVTAEPSTPGVDFVSRFFAPACGIDEDAVTGSAHCCLGPFWGERLHKTDLVGYQLSRRGGMVRVGLRGDRVLLGGQGVTVLQGEVTSLVSARA